MFLVIRLQIEDVVSYFGPDEQVMGPLGYLQQFFVRSLVGQWRVPVFFAFDTPVTSGLLNQVIRDIETAGAKVMATVSNLGGTNQALWRELGIDPEVRTWFPNPMDASR